MAIPNLKYDYFTYADYLSWNDGKRWELIDGIAYDMSPAPNTRHQRISLRFSAYLYNFFKGKSYEVFAAPFDVRLGKINAENSEITSVVQPYLCIFCDPTKIDKHGAVGAPDLIIEILSESTIRRDLNAKLRLYQRYGVKEYWIADPESNTIEVFKPNKEGIYLADPIYTFEDILIAGIFPTLEIPMSEIFAD